MKNQPNKILVLTDFTEASYVALRYAISIAKNASSAIDLFHVADPSLIVQSDNQASAIREINAARKKNIARLASLVEIIETENLKASYKYALGNISAEIAEYLEGSNPDIVVVGRNRINSFGKATEFLLDSYGGALMIVGKDSELHSQSKISIAWCESTLARTNMNLAFGLNELTTMPITVYNNIGKAKTKCEDSSPQLWESYISKVEKVQFKNSNNKDNVTGIIKHIDEEKLDLICLGRGKKNNSVLNWFFSAKTIPSEVIKRTNTPILILPNA